MPALPVERRSLPRQVDQPQILVDSDLRPHAGVRVDVPRTVFPGIVAELARPRNGVEGPDQSTGSHIEGAYQSLRVVVCDGGLALLHGRADDHGVFNHDGGRMDADLSGFQIDLLPRAVHYAYLQIDDAVFSERSD